MHQLGDKYMEYANVLIRLSPVVFMDTDMLPAPSNSLKCSASKASKRCLLQIQCYRFQLRLIDDT